MAIDKPTTYPEWARDPSGSLDTTPVTEPTTDQKDSGWQPATSTEFPSGKPVRQIANWLAQLAWWWFVWLDRVTRRTSDFHPNGPLPGNGSAPSTGAGLSILAADFAGRAYIDGYEVGPIDSSAYAYSATSDTYWDLGRDGEWHPVIVAALDPEPVVTSNAERFYKVTTDATDRTVVEDRRPSRISFSVLLEFVENIRLGLAKLTDGAAAAVARLFVPYSKNYSYLLVTEFYDVEASPNGTTRVYLDSDGLLNIVRGARWNGSLWVKDSNPPLILTRLAWRSSSGFQLRALAETVVGASFADSVWDTQPNGADYLRTLEVDGAVNIGNTGSENAFWQADTPKFGNGSVNESIVHRSYEHKLGSYGHFYALLAAAAGTDDGIGIGTKATKGWESAANCSYSSATGQWARTAAGDAYKLEVSSVGMRLLYHAAADASLWDDIVSSGNWNVLFTSRESGEMWIPAHEGSWDWSEYVQDLVSGNVNAFFTPVRKTSATNAAGMILFHDRIPNGALITEIDVVLKPAEGSGNVEVAGFRLNPSTGVTESLNDGTNGEQNPTGSSFITLSLTLGASEALRTIDRATYCHGVWISSTGNSVTEIRAIRVAYEVR
ncbi:MAG: hypothetical protein HY791_02850 [Deltaproteobacteria bacterium]|nr:hypothetical protein [Deltaproteobacteria bacterium]